ncbi:hypothetical protein KIN20_027981 [Parelaphostrongylus tenuis]|uniref:Uncharacterized protein n=1 Tax=Parelaphostrongylus tenuis TaxID=148309 RepID=A0AAD5R090_PARTN|nr:hypothetical protein KIN20_027981 [Parelaphostrongylus tenuis]
MMDLLSVEMCIDSYKTKMNMAKFSTVSLVISLAATFSVVFGCGVLPAGQESSRPFTVTGFTTLPVAMVYSTATNVQATFPGIATSEAGAVGFVQRLVMETIFDVLERQGRSALLPDAVISAILGQLSVTISYKPLSCEMAGGPDQMLNMKTACIIVDSTVTGICTTTENVKCDAAQMVTITPINATISGTLTTSNIIMASWSRAMWQSVVDRAVRMLASGPFRSHFLSAIATVGGN